MGVQLKRWTPQDDEELRSMVLAGRRPIEIAAKLQRSRPAVLKRARILGLSFKLVVLSPQKPKGIRR